MATQTDYQYTWGNSVDGFLHTFIAEGAIAEGELVELGTAGRQVKKHTTTLGNAVIGVCHEAASDGDPVVICCPGPIRKVRAAAAGITRGQLVVPSSVTAGACMSQAYANGSTVHGVIGIALETGDELNERVPVLMATPWALNA